MQAKFLTYVDVMDPLARPRPEEIAAAVVFLASPRASVPMVV